MFGKVINRTKKFLKLIWKRILKDKSLTIVIIFSILFSSWLMGSTFGYENGNITMGDKLWSDFNSHLPLIRSFSHGDNIPPEYPLFTGEKIKYHFLFYFLVGMLERIGLRIDIALNLLSIIGMAGLMISIYLLAHKLTRSRMASWLSVLFLIFNSTLSWAFYLYKHPFNKDFFNDLFTGQRFASFGPYDDNVVSAFWNLNIFTNQRHLAFSFFMMFLAIWGICYSKKRWPMFLGIFIIGIMPWLHKAILLLLMLCLVGIFIAEKAKRQRIFVASLAGIGLALPGLSYLASTSASDIKIWWGYIYNSTTWKGFSENGYLRWIVFWLLNLGLVPFLAFAGWIKIDKLQFKSKNIFINIYHFLFSPKRIWAMLAVLVFIIGNIFTFAADVATNHKLFNFSVMILNIYVAYLIVYLFKKKNVILPSLALIFTVFMILGGIVDLFPIINENKAIFSDIPNNKIATWIYNNTPADSKFFNVTSDTSPITLAGRKIFFGNEYLTWSIGYKTLPRREEIVDIISGIKSKSDVCKYLITNGLNYIFINKRDANFLEQNVDFDFFESNFYPVYVGDSAYTIYNTSVSCSNI